MAPDRLARAIKLAQAHPAVRGCRIIDETDAGDVTVEFAILTELPAAWRAAAESPNGVREIEPVRFAFSRTYPLDAPKITLRQDFNRRLPHINPGPPDQPPVPCVVAGSPRELIQSRGIEGLVDQMADWLDKASMVALLDPTQGWEPVRRDNHDDIIVVDGEGIRSLATATGGSALVQTGFVFLERRECNMYAIDQRSSVSTTFANVRSQRRSLTPTHHVGMSLGMIFWAADHASGEPFIVPDYEPETVTTLRSLRTRAAVYGCGAKFDGLVNQLAVLFHEHRLVPTPLAITFLVRRPFNLIGVSSPIELCSYVIHLTSSQDLIDEDRAMVRLPAVCEQLSVEILRRASGDSLGAVREPWTLIGCGSVGSKLAVHAARRGFGPSLVVDRSLMEPHNYARHALLPAASNAPVGGVFKAADLHGALAGFAQPVDSEIADAVALIASEEGRERLAGKNAGIFNTTASIVIREQLAFTDWTRRPAIGEAHLLGAGRAAYIAFEGDEGNPNLSDLAAESYRLIGSDPELRRAVFAAEAQPITIGQGCSSLTFPMPDDRLSALSAGLSQALALRGFPLARRAGEIRIGKLAQDGLSQAWTHEVVEPWTMVRDGADGAIAVRISARVDRLIRDEVARRPGSETGGVIVGRFSHIGNAFHVVDVIEAPSDSKFSAHEFVLGTQGLKAEIRRLEESTGGSLHVLGTWHNHLVTSGPSGLDAETAARLALCQYLPVLLLIALPGSYTALIAEAFDSPFTRASAAGSEEGLM